METTPERNTAWATLCGTAHLISIPAVVNLNENPKNNKKHYFWKKAAMTVGKVIFWCIRLDSLIFWCHGLPIWCPWWSPLVSFSSTRTCDLSIYRTVHHVVERVASVPINTTGDVWFHWPWLPNSFARLSAARCHSNSAPAWCEVQKCIRLLYPENWDVLWDTFAFKGWKSEDSHFDSFFGLKAGGFRPCHQFKRFWHGGNMEWRNEVYHRPFLRTLIIPIFVMLIILSVEKWSVKRVANKGS